MKALSKSLARRGLANGYRTAHLLGLHRCQAQPVAYVAERADWVIRWVGDYCVAAIEKSHPGIAAVVTSPLGLFDRVVHFGSQFMWRNWLDVLPPSNRYVATIYHGKPEDGPEMARNVDFILANHHRLARVVTAASSMERRLLEWGVPRERLVRVPLGVDVEAFRIPSADERKAARARFGVPEGALCIGSFQKDGVGWGDGLEPKLIKGPDVFVDAVAKLARDFPVFVLLTGPARGYVRRGLEGHGIPYRHEFLADYRAVAERYRALDLYLMTSREEGGPQSLLESLASGVALVSTRTGMAEDVIEDGQNGVLVDVGDVAGLASAAAALASDAARAEAFRRAGRVTAERYGWAHVGERLYEDVYRPLIG